MTVHVHNQCDTIPVPAARNRVLTLQAVTLLWMTVECGVALSAAASSHSIALLAFGSDSAVEWLSAILVALQYIPRVALRPAVAQRLAGWLLFVLAAIVTATAFAGLVLGMRPEPSRAGIAVTAAALLLMPTLAALKRREARRTGDGALRADAAQSATCAYLALLTLASLAANALLHISWLDSAAALCAVPLLVKEGRAAMRGESCGCH